MQVQILNPFQGNYVTARNAREDLDLDAILAGCNQVDEQAGNLDYGLRNLSLSKSSFGVDSLSIDNQSVVGGAIDEYYTALNNIKNAIYNSTNEIRINAINQFNNIQQAYNNEAIDLENQYINQN